MSKQHTPGPWVTGAIAWGQYAVDGANGEEVTSWIDEADALLIAAAPELLEALVDSLCALEVCGRDFDHVMGKARAAIAKARGEA